MAWHCLSGQVLLCNFQAYRKPEICVHTVEQGLCMTLFAGLILLQGLAFLNRSHNLFRLYNCSSVRIDGLLLWMCHLILLQSTVTTPISQRIRLCLPHLEVLLPKDNIYSILSNYHLFFSAGMIAL